MSLDDAIIRPTRGRYSPKIGPMVAMVSNKDDLIMISEQLNLKEETRGRLYSSRLFSGMGSLTGFSAIGPYIGAPYAIMVLENLIAWGAKRIVCFGWCGAISSDVKIGDFIVPTGAIVDEGTSIHYGGARNELVYASTQLAKDITAVLDRQGVSYHQGDIWTTDAVYRETQERVLSYQEQNVLAVEMELSALFSVAHFRGIHIGAVLAVSDELSALTWHPGFKNHRFIKSRHRFSRILNDLCHVLM